MLNPVDAVNRVVEIAIKYTWHIGDLTNAWYSFNGGRK
jgi:hypothetical protein